MKRALFLVLLAGAAVGACNGIFGVEEATTDPSLVDSGGQPAEAAPPSEAAPSDAPTGDPTSCETYCALMKKNCTGVNNEYVTDDSCLKMCSIFERGDPNDQTNDSRECRIYHANSAGAGPEAAAVHCRHAGPTGAGHCGTDPCRAFCLLQAAICPDVQADGGELGCRSDCATYTYVTTAGSPDLAHEGDTLNCRVQHLESAASAGGAATHCPHTAKVSVWCNEEAGHESH